MRKALVALVGVLVAALAPACGVVDSKASDLTSSTPDDVSVTPPEGDAGSEPTRDSSIAGDVGVNSRDDGASVSPDGPVTAPPDATAPAPDGPSPGVDVDHPTRDAGRPPSEPFAGRTLVVPAGEQIQRYVDQASDGDRVLVKAGVYRQNVRVTKRIWLASEVPGGAKLYGTASPPLKKDTGTGSGVGIELRGDASGRADGAVIDGFEVSYYAQGIRLMSVARAVIQNNSLTSNYGNGLVLRDCNDIEVHHNRFADPYLPNDVLGSVTAGPPGSAQSDYGLAIYGSIDTFVHHNSFFGVFNQALSFKVQNLNGRVEDNTFEGCAMSALIIGQNASDVETFSRFRRTGPSTGVFKVLRNRFGAAMAARGSATVEYFARSPIRIWSLGPGSDVEISGNVVVAALRGFSIECGATASGAAGCARGRIRITNNLINGRVIDTRGTTRAIGQEGIWVYSGVQATVQIDHNTVLHFAPAISSEGGPVDVTNNIFVANGESLAGTSFGTVVANTFFQSGSPSGTASSTVAPLFVETPNYRVAQASQALAPDLSFGCAFRLRPGSADAVSGVQGTYRGAYPPGATCP